MLRQDCRDEADWHSAEDGFAFVTCDYISGLDPSCINYRDYGQKTHWIPVAGARTATADAGWFAVNYLDGSGIQGGLVRDVVRIGMTGWQPKLPLVLSEF